MSDRVYPARVQVMVAGQIYSGCGAPLASPVQGKAGR
jgi:uncharacterized membrane protein